MPQECGAETANILKRKGRKLRSGAPNVRDVEGRDDEAAQDEDEQAQLDEKPEEVPCFGFGSHGCWSFPSLQPVKRAVAAFEAS